MTWRPLLGVGLAGVAPLLCAQSVAAGDSPSNPDRPLRGPATAVAPQMREGVVGRLLRSQERPVAGAMISATSLDRPSKPVPDIAILTDAEGVFAWPLRAGTYRLAAVTDGRSIATAVVTVEPGEVTRVDLHAPR